MTDFLGFQFWHDCCGHKRKNEHKVISFDFTFYFFNILFCIQTQDILASLDGYYPLVQFNPTTYILYQDIKLKQPLWVFKSGKWFNSTFVPKFLQGVYLHINLNSCLWKLNLNQWKWIHFVSVSHFYMVSLYNVYE